MPTEGSLRASVLAGEPTGGTFLNLGSPVSSEMCASAGCDWILIDLEHGSGTTADLPNQLQAVSRTGTPAVVRVELPARTHVSRALDFRVEGIMFSRINDAAEARDAVRYLRLPPLGVGGAATCVCKERS